MRMLRHSRRAGKHIYLSQQFATDAGVLFRVSHRLPILALFRHLATAQAELISQLAIVLISTFANFRIYIFPYLLIC